MTIVSSRPEVPSRIGSGTVLEPIEHPLVASEIYKAWEEFLRTSEIKPYLRSWIAERWQKCRAQNLNPHMLRVPTTSTATELRTLLERGELGLAGKAVLDDFSPVLDASGHVAVLADARGVILYEVGDHRIYGPVEAVNFMPGACWSEEEVGPNGVGTSLVLGRPLFVFGPEHFCEGWQHLLCYGCPVRDPNTHRVLGAVDISGPAKEVSQAVFNLTVSLANSIERMLKAYSAKRRAVLLEEWLAAEKKWPNDGVILTDENERVLEIDSRATELFGRDIRFLLGQELTGYLPSARELLKKSLETGSWSEADGEISGRLVHVRCGPVLTDNRVVGSIFVLDAPEARQLRRPAANPPKVVRTATRHELHCFRSIIGASPAFVEALELAHVAAHSDKTVLITGETGTGKELFAQAIHSESVRSRGPFIDINCGALPRELIESELFGYVSGAFTGGSPRGAVGKFEVADGGTIFLDEISSLPLELQAVLLKVLDTKVVTRLGAIAPIRVDVRVIAAANQGLKELVEQGRFRADLFYRLNVFPLRLPSLRERRDDILTLAETFLARECERLGRQLLTLSPEARDCMLSHDWPGNIRELRNLCERLVEVKQSVLVRAEDLPEELSSSRRGETARADHQGTAAADPLELTYRVLRETDYNISETARRLGISRTTIYNRLKRRPLGSEAR